MPKPFGGENEKEALLHMTDHRRRNNPSRTERGNSPAPLSMPSEWCLAKDICGQFRRVPGPPGRLRLIPIDVCRLGLSP